MTEGHETCGQPTVGRNRPQRGRTTSSLAPVRPLRGRLERGDQLSAGSIPFGHSTRGYSHSPPSGTVGNPNCIPTTRGRQNVTCVNSKNLSFNECLNTLYSYSLWLYACCPAPLRGRTTRLYQSLSKWGFLLAEIADPGRMLILVQEMVKRDWKVFFLPLKFGDTRPKMKMEAPTLLSKT